jgi:hypothetical protein
MYDYFDCMESYNEGLMDGRSDARHEIDRLKRELAESKRTAESNLKRLNEVVAERNRYYELRLDEADRADVANAKLEKLKGALTLLGFNPNI